ncbi:hypothetical protein MMC20_006443 [Loxospora ochrophaea]|nr:hypothetical protein [Loxospora ochrophaea]
MNNDHDSPDDDGSAYRGHQEQMEAEKTWREPSSLPHPAGHKRSLSGSILSKLSFLRATSETNDFSSEKSQVHDAKDDLASPRRSEGAMASTVQQGKARKRKGSLRKTAILGTGKLKVEPPERWSFNSKPTAPGQRNGSSVSSDHDSILSPTSPVSPDNLPTPRQTSGASVPFQVPSVGHIDHASSTRVGFGINGGILHAGGLGPIANLGDMSTTDEDDVVTFPRNAFTTNAVSIHNTHSSSGSDSYFPPQVNPVQRRRSGNKAKSPLAVLAVDSSTTPQEWDYSETEWWGWVVLIVTWVVFVVGMGSCFGIWSWAWDVGETPYAPPELEDDPTLPIVGYYPALIILTSVMAWVWVVVAWVGMKYFKHANISGADV